MNEIKCWCCGKTATKTSRNGNFLNVSYRCYCAECFKEVTETDKRENEMYIYLKHKRMLLSALTILENQNTNMYQYKEAIEAVSEHLEENPDKYDSAYEVLAAIVLIQNRIRCKPQYPIGRYHVDFYLPELRIILEIDGDRHKYNKTKDSKRDATIKNLMNGQVDIIRIRTDFLDSNARKLPEAIEKVHKYHCDGHINWKELYG